MTLLRDHEWRTKYDSDERSLVDDFYNPALQCAVQYDRSTGFFSSRVLTLAARGVEGLVRNDGRMRLVVGCTLGPEEVQAIEKGISLRDAVGATLERSSIAPASDDEHAALELLAWMIARGILDVKVAVPCTAARKPVAGRDGIFHEKAGIVTDKTGEKLAFNGSVNETPHGWGGTRVGNWESFHVFTDWAGGQAHVDAECESFKRLWNDEAKHCLVVDVRTAVEKNLLQFLPANDGKPRRLLLEEPPQMPSGPEEAQHESPHAPDAMPRLPSTHPTPVATDELRRQVWQVVQHGPSQADGGERVGEATSAIVPWPHQVRAFHRAYDPWPPKLLIADEVGLGKTIEAGMVLRQAALSGRARRILVMAPKSVLTQWQIELREKFNLNWPIYDGQSLRWYASRAVVETERKVGRDEWHKESFVLASSHLMRRTDRARDLLEVAAPWDLVVLDEAHHARRRGAGGVGRDRGPNQLLRLMQGLVARTQGLLLLTATPMQVDPVEVWDLLALLGLPQSWTASAFTGFFQKLGHGNPSHEDFEVLAALFRDVEAMYGAATLESVLRFVGGSKLAAKKVLEALRDRAQNPRRQLETDRRRAALQVIRMNSPVSRLVSRHTRELLRRYHAAGKLTSRIATRHVVDEFVTLSPQERKVYDDVEDYISTTYDQASEKERNAVGFVMTIYRRRLASSFAALSRTLSERLTAVGRKQLRSPIDEEDLSDDEIDDETMDEEQAAKLEEQALLAEETSDIESLLAAIRRLPVDTKANVLVDHLARLREQGYQQAIVFTQYTDTLDFLRGHLLKQGLRVMCFSGRGGEVVSSDATWRTISRDETKRMFRERKADVLLCTDAAAEGLNFQFCGALVNYDMPWNPMRVEQRIGRIDRLGQAFEDIRIVNLHYDDTVETDVYLALRERIDLFSKFVGKLQPILAALPRKLASVALARRTDRDRERETLKSTIIEDVGQREADPFDIDAITEAELEEPPRPAPLFDLDDLDTLLRRAELLPPGVEVLRKLSAREYEYTVPGLPDPIRVTTSREMFENNPGTYELWSPGSAVFPTLSVPEPDAPLPRLRALLSKMEEG